MNYERLRESVCRHEGYRELPYRDSLGKWTVGYGHLIHEAQLSALVNHRTVGNLLDFLSDPERHELWLSEDLIAAESDARRFIGDKWGKLSDVRREVITEMAFQLGADRLGGFQNFRAAVIEGRWVRAKAEMLDSRWEKQTPRRAHELADRFLAG